MGALSFLKESILADEHAAKKGFLQAREPRIKAVSLLIFLILAVLVKHVMLLACLYAISLLLAQLSSIRLGLFLKRTWIFIPLFSLFIAIPAIFSMFSPGEAIANFNLGNLNLIITRQGMDSAILFVVRVAVSVSFVVLLTLTTRHFVLLKTLRVFKVPQIFVMTIGMCYRYVYLFIEIIENTYLAIKSRVGTRIGRKDGQRVVAWNIAHLWQRSYRLSQDVYSAMLSRGFRGEPAVLHETKVAAGDLAWFLFVLIISVSILYLNWKLTYLSWKI